MKLIAIFAVILLSGCATKEDAEEVFEDADRLHSSLTKMVEVEPVKETP